MRRPRIGTVLALVIAALAVTTSPASAATGSPSSGSDPVTAEQRSALELAAEAYTLHTVNAQRVAGNSRGGVRYGDVSSKPRIQAWTDMMTVSRHWATRLNGMAGLEHNPRYAAQIGHWTGAGENVASRLFVVRGGTPSSTEVRNAIERISQGWWESTGHRQLWMNGRWDHFSVGVSIEPYDHVGGYDYWRMTAAVNFRELYGSVPSRWHRIRTDGSTPPNETTGKAAPVSGAPQDGRRFGDVAPGHHFHDEIVALADAGITRGCGDGDFCPDAPVTRGQMAAFLDRALGLPDGRAAFRDTRGHDFAVSIAALARAGITRGCNPPDNTQFCPDEPVTRGQMAAFLDRALALRDGNRRFVDTRGHVLEDNISALATAGITRGCNPPYNSRYCPGQPVTRGQMAAMLVRAGVVD